MKKPERVDSIGPFKELWEELHDKKTGVIITLIIDTLLAVVASSFIYITFCRLRHTLFPKMYPSIRVFVSSYFSLGIIKTWYLTIPLIFVIAYLSFKLYRSIRKTYDKNYDENYLKSKTSSYGNNHWQTPEELEEHFVLVDDIEDTTLDILGKYKNKYVCIDYNTVEFFGKGINRIICGAAGSGKTSGFMLLTIYQLIRRGDSAILLDSKGDIYRYTSAVGRYAGYKIRVLNIKPTELINSDGFDMFKTLDAADLSLDVKADVLTNTILDTTIGDEKVEKYWKDNEFNLIKAIIMAIAVSPSYQVAGTRNLPEVYNFLASCTTDSLKQVMEGFKQTRPEIYKAYMAFAKCEPRNQGQIINGAMIRLRLLGNTVLQKVLSSDEIDTTAPMKEKCLYYVIVPDQDNTYKFVSALFFTQLFMDLCSYHDSLSDKEKKNTKRVEFLLDEFYSCGGIYGLPQKLSSVRSRNIGITIILQSLSQLDSLYTEPEVITIKNNCPIICSLAVNEVTTAEEFSKIFGNQTIITESHRYIESTGDVLHAHGAVQKTMSEQQRPLIYPDDLLNGNVTRDEVLYRIGDMMPVRIEKAFAEKRGEIYHFLYEETLRLAEEKGERIASRHKPVWRHNLELAEKERKERIQEDVQIPPEPVPVSDPVPDTFEDLSVNTEGYSTLDDIFKGYDRS